MKLPAMRSPGVRRLWHGFLAILLICVGAELAIDRHGQFGLDGVFGFNAVFGFAACVALVLFAKLLGMFLKRPDSYHGD